MSEMRLHQGAPRSLPDGTWGVEIEGGGVEVGDPVSVTTQTGKTWTTVVSEVVESGDPGFGRGTVTLARTVRGGRRAEPAAAPSAAAPASGKTERMVERIGVMVKEQDAALREMAEKVEAIRFMLAARAKDGGSAPQPEPQKVELDDEDIPF